MSEKIKPRTLITAVKMFEGGYGMDAIAKHLRIDVSVVEEAVRLSMDVADTIRRSYEAAAGLVDTDVEG